MPIKTKKVQRDFTHTFRDGSTANYEIKITYKNAPMKTVKKTLNNNNNNNNNHNYNNLISQMLRKRKMALQKHKEKQAKLNMLERKRSQLKKKGTMNNLDLHKYLMRARYM